MRKFVVIWFNTQQYGGPEEGGWWYTTGEPQKVYTVTSEEELAEKQKLADEQVEKQNEGRRPLYSVASTGRYSVTVEDEYPEAYPAETPYYC